MSFHVWVGVGVGTVLGWMPTDVCAVPVPLTSTLIPTNTPNPPLGTMDSVKTTTEDGVLYAQVSPHALRVVISATPGQEAKFCNEAYNF